jgi:hypothetical protein
MQKLLRVSFVGPPRVVVYPHGGHGNKLSPLLCDRAEYFLGYFTTGHRMTEEELAAVKGRSWDEWVTLLEAFSFLYLFVHSANHEEQYRPLEIEM